MRAERGRPARRLSRTATLPRSAGACCRVEVLRLDGGGRILPHTAPTNARLKVHLGLAGAAGLTVAGARRDVEPGAVLAFDDAFFHEVAKLLYW